MPVDVGGFDPLTVSMRDYIDGHRETHDVVHSEEHVAAEKLVFQAIDSLKERINILEKTIHDHRYEDRRKVEVALEAVEAAARIHATGHEQQHTAHQEIHGVEKENLTKASAALDKRLEGMNGIRDQLRDQAAKFVDREVDIAQNTATEKRIDQNRVDLAELRLLIATKVGREDNKQEFTQSRRADVGLRNSTVGMMVAVAALVVSVVVVIVNVLLA